MMYVTGGVSGVICPEEGREEKGEENRGKGEIVEQVKSKMVYFCGSSDLVFV